MITTTFRYCLMQKKKEGGGDMPTIKDVAAEAGVTYNGIQSIE